MYSVQTGQHIPFVNASGVRWLACISIYAGNIWLQWRCWLDVPAAKRGWLGKRTRTGQVYRTGSPDHSPSLLRLMAYIALDQRQHDCVQWPLRQLAFMNLSNGLWTLAEIQHPRQSVGVSQLNFLHKQVPPLVFLSTCCLLVSFEVPQFLQFFLMTFMFSWRFFPPTSLSPQPLISFAVKEMWKPLHVLDMI